MRLVLKLLCYAAALAAMWWLVPQIELSFQRATAAGSTPDASRAYALFSAYLVVSAALAAFVAWDVSRFLGSQAGRLFLGGGRVASITPSWWKAERLCRNHRPIEAIEVLRAYLNTHPRHWCVAVRIAEIYQLQLNDSLAAALEYKQILKRRLPPSARAEIMVRLAACQLLLRDGDESAAMLRQVVEQFPRAAAAQKATRRLARIEKPSA